MLQKPGTDFVVAMQRGDGMRGAAARATLMNVSSIGDEQLNHSNVPAFRSNMEWRVTCLEPGQVRVRSMLQQPTYARDIFGLCPAQNVTQGRNPSWNSVNVDTKTLKLFKRRKIPTPCGDVRRNAVGRIGAALEQDLCKLRMTHVDERAPKGGARKLGMPVPIVFGIRVSTPPQQFTRNLHKSVRSFRRTA